MQSIAQTARLSGFITDVSDGQPLEGATIVLRDAAIGDGAPPVYGAAATSDGIYSIRSIEPGGYVLEVSFIGYESYRETLEISADEVLPRSFDTTLLRRLAEPSRHFYRTPKSPRIALCKVACRSIFERALSHSESTVKDTSLELLQWDTRT